MSAIYECECDSFEMYEEQDSFEMAEAVPGPGVPSGGLTGQVLKKRSDEDFDTEWADESGGGGGTSDYTQLSNKPQINGNTLAGNKTGTDLGLVNAVTGKQLSTEDYTTADKNKLSGIEAQANKTVIDNTLTNAGQAADAKAVGDEISQLESDVEGLQGDLAGLDAGDVAYDNSLTYAAGTVGEELSSQRNTLTQFGDYIDDLETEAATIEQSTAIIINGNTSASNVTPGQYVYLKNSTIAGLTDKLYTYTGSSTKTAGNTFISSELSAVSAGGLNDLYDKGLHLASYKASPVDTTFHIYTTNLNTYDHVAICGFTPADSNIHVRIANLDNNGVYTYQLVDSVTGNIDTTNYDYLVCILWCKRPPLT